MAINISIDEVAKKELNELVAMLKLSKSKLVRMAAQKF
ncbi:ribbon-helix-helix protein, CopG family [Candidatus Pacearchaeota archaeon]|nr:ribbon-helix-helix protein, CopG family [Candidatus Pacearchaeota archaeon]